MTTNTTNPTCPICQLPLKNIGSGPNYNYYKCPTLVKGKRSGPNPPDQHCLLFGPGKMEDKNENVHYLVLIDYGVSIIRSQIIVPGFLLKYTNSNNKTEIYKLQEKSDSCYRHTFTFDGIFPIDFDNLNKTAHRLDTLITFS